MRINSPSKDVNLENSPRKNENESANDDFDVPSAIFNDLKKDLDRHPKISGVTSQIRHFRDKDYLYKFHPLEKITHIISFDQIDEFTKLSRKHIEILNACGVNTPQTFYFSGGIKETGDVSEAGISTITKIVDGAKKFPEVKIDDDFLNCFIKTTEGLLEYLKRILAQHDEQYIMYDIFGKMSQFVYTTTPHPSFVLVDVDPRFFDLSHPQIRETFLLETRRRLLLNIQIVADKIWSGAKRNRIPELHEMMEEVENVIDAELEKSF